MSATVNEIFTKINNLYNKKGFLDKYGLDIWTTVIICLVFFVITSYFYIMNNIKPIVADWENQKCSPSVMPFAGLINKGPNDSAFDFTGKNFTSCVQSILTNIIAYAFQPIYYIMKNLTDSFSELITALNSIRAMFDKIRISINEFSTETMGRTLNITMPIVQLLINIKSIGAKMVGTLTASLYTLFGSYLALKSFFLFILNLITTILIILVSIIVVFLIISFIPLFGSWAIPIAATHIAIMIAILIPTIMIQIFMSNVLSLSSKSLPAVPRCFSDKTMIGVKVNNNNNNDEFINKSIADVEVGDILKYGEKVTAIMKFSAAEQAVYSINGIKVTGEHRIFHKTLGWIKVKTHPERIFLNNFNEPFVYCLGTDTKTFFIENNNFEKQLFSDWDDIDEDVKKSLYFALPHNFSNNDIHHYLENGIIGSSLIQLKSGGNIPINKIQPYDILFNGEIVLGVIKVDALELNDIYEYKHNESVLYGANINICLEEPDKNKLILSKIELNREKDKYLYQLLTNTGSFTVNGLIIRDYNYGIDKYLL